MWVLVYETFCKFYRPKQSSFPFFPTIWTRPIPSYSSFTCPEECFPTKKQNTKAAAHRSRRSRYQNYLATNKPSQLFSSWYRCRRAQDDHRNSEIRIRGVFFDSRGFVVRVSHGTRIFASVNRARPNSSGRARRHPRHELLGGVTKTDSRSTYHHPSFEHCRHTVRFDVAHRAETERI